MRAHSLSVVAALGAAAALAVAQTPATAAGTPSPTNRPDVAAEQAKAGQAGAALGLRDQSLTVKDVVTDADGTRHVRFERSWDGLRVVGGDFVATKNARGTFTGTTLAGGTSTIALTSRTPRTTSAAAQAVASSAAGYAPSRVSSELVVHAAGAAPRLAWDVVTEGVRADQTPSRLHTVVDATSGRLLESWDTVTPGTGSSMYSGTVTLNTTGSTGAFQLKDTLGNYTTDLGGATTGTGTQFTDADDIWGNGSASSRQTAAVDAQFGAERTFAFYKTVLGRNGIWNNGSGARSRVHYGNAYVNAFWDGTQMTYGDGSGNTHPLTSIDVAGHEMSHGVTENSAALVYRGEAGGLNESSSDIFGTMVEWFANSAADSPDYLIGEKIDINGNGTPLRYMDKPSKDGRSSDCWSSALGRLDPHYSSGPLNHWFFLASEGSGATTVDGVAYNSPTCNGSSVTGTGNDAVAKIWYRTLTTKLTSRSGYQAARDGVVASAKELYGTGSAQCVAVENAMKAISAPAGKQTCAS